MYTIFDQLPNGNIAATSEEGQFLTLFDNFTVEEDICDIHWWGVTAYYDEVDGWVSCTENPVQFFINFWNDDGAGKPDITAPVCTYEAVVTGQDTYDLFAGWPIMYYSLDLDPCCQLQSGWVSIQGGSDPNCWFLWHSSEDGDLISWQYDESATDPDSIWQQPDAPPYDLAICLTTSPPGACCVDGECLPIDQGLCEAGEGEWFPDGDCDNPEFECPSGCYQYLRRGRADEPGFFEKYGSG